MKKLIFLSLIFFFLTGFSPFEKEAKESKEGRKKYATGDMEGAENEFDKASKRLDKNAHSFYNLGNALQKKGDNEAALESYRKSLETGNADSLLKSRIFHNMGNSFATLQNLKEAEEFYIRSLLEKPHDDTAENLEIVRRMMELQEEQEKEKQEQEQEQNKDEEKNKEESQNNEEGEEGEEEQSSEQDQGEQEEKEKEEGQNEEQSAAEPQEDKEEKDGKETMMQQFKQRKNLQISPFMLKKNSRSKSGQTW
ncbi:MAG: tetratricopeptide repeat protein [bacterium]